jgi:hypothetical protein
MNLIGIISIWIFNLSNLISILSKFGASLFDPDVSSTFIFQGQEFSVIGIFLPLLHFYCRLLALRVYFSEFFVFLFECMC